MSAPALAPTAQPTDDTAEQANALGGLPASGAVDFRTLMAGLAAGIGFFILGLACLNLSRFDAALASVWLPNACAVAMLLLVRAHNEIPLYAGIAAASVAANVVAGTPLANSLVFTAANLAGIMLVTGLTRAKCGARPDMTELAHLGRFLQYGGAVGPLVASAIAAFAIPLGGQPVWVGALTWFLADALGMILVVPAALLVADAVRTATAPKTTALFKRAVFTAVALVAVWLVFRQDIYPLLFLVPPITLLVAFRGGGIGTVLFVPMIAGVASWMTVAGYGPIVNSSKSALDAVFVLQAFVAANFLTGLPIAAILAGRERMTEELARGRGELGLLAETITDAVLRLDRDRVCIYASPSVEDVMGRPPEDLVGHPIASRGPEDAHARIESALDSLLSGQSDKERITYRRLLDDEEGTPVFIEADCAIVLDPITGERDGVVVSARDVTERVELELLLTRARRHAENAARAKSEFLANMSHEIRTPMNGVLGFAELMLQGDLEPDNRRHTEMIVESGRSMMLLLNDILDLSKIEAGQIAIDSQPVDLVSTLAECVQLHLPNAEGKGLRLNFTASDAVKLGGEGARENPWVATDALRLRQIVLNLIGNAVKFTEKGSVDVQLSIQAEQFRVDVKDTGIGIGAKRVQTIFAPFTQGENDTSRRFGGTGLGLTISRQLAELLGGQIEVCSEVGIGSTFSLILPAHYVEPEVPALSQAAEASPADLPEASRILLVEDHDVNRMLGTEMLERCGQCVATAHDGNEAIAMVIDSVMRGSHYDLVLMDIQMPGCDGYAATRAIRAEGISPADLPIIALTANAFPEDISAARDAGMQGHLAKPLVFADLARMLQRWLPTRIVEDQSVEHAAPVAKAVNRGEQEAPSPAGQSETAGGHSPTLLKRWNQRRSEAIEAVRGALEQGHLGGESAAEENRDELARLVHKLAGTAAMFGEAELGDQAAALERALRMGLDAETQASLAFELLSVADDPADAPGAAAS
ncbi:ATP-binding protein [Erythrobacter sp. NAP1]|uniref:ATP-binding protein n=1 Tax=Erythrobacter sp. NAP1 TaxID=237727 RepID=UPI001389AB6F|nr:ATP-binding protein [Erythrobacter sp. NAP1]